MKTKLTIFSFIIALMVTLGIVLTPSVPFVSAESVDYGYIINNYHVNVEVGLNNSLHITEELQVSFGDYYTYGESHGIYRYIPKTLTVTREKDGKWQDYSYGVGIDLLHAYVVESGVTYQEATTENDNLVILIRENQLVNGQTRNYVIEYNYNIGYDRVDWEDELYLNLLGDQWNTYVENFSFTIHMPKEFTETPVFYTGAFGTSTPSTIVTSTVTGTTITGSVNDSINPFEAVTIRLTLPEGYYDQVRTFSIWGDIAVLAVLLAVVGTMMYIYQTKRKFKSVVQTVEFYPPNEIDPVHLAYTLQGYVTTKQITSLIIYFASKGYLKIIDTDGKLSLQKLKNLKRGAPSYQKVVFDALFEKGKTTKIGNVLDKVLGVTVKEEETTEKEDKQKTYEPISLKELQKSAETTSSIAGAASTVSAECGGRLNTKTVGYSVLIMLLGIIPIFAFFGLYSARLHLAFGFVYLVFVGLAGMGSAALFYLAYSSIAYRKKEGNKGVFAVIGYLLFLSVGVFSMSGFWENVVDPMYLRFAVLLPLLMGLVLTPKMVQFNDEYRELFGKTLGFRKNILLTEKKRMEMLLKDNPSYFYDILPYAYVMGITNQFAKNFEGLSLEAPTWYVSNNTVFNVIMFNHLMNTSFTNFSNQIVSRNHASGYSGKGIGGGSFGGGFSGGGFGGGGGGRA